LKQYSFLSKVTRTSKHNSGFAEVAAASAIAMGEGAKAEVVYHDLSCEVAATKREDSSERSGEVAEWPIAAVC